VDEALRLRPTSPTALLIGGLLDRDRGRPEEALRRVDILEELGYPGVARQLADSVAEEGVSAREDFP
jgi:hypothetical protein